MASRTTPLPPLVPLPNPNSRRPAAHLVGIGGAGMKALAELLVGLGWKVTGSDRQESETLDRMRRRGLRVFAGHDDAALPAVVDLLVYSPAVGPENTERAEAARRGMPQFTLPEMLGALTAGRTGVAVTGTHGKSTTTAMVATVLRRAGREPSAAFGAELCGSGRSGWAGDGNLLVVEGCEYRRNFLALRPTHAAILNVEADHFDCFADFTAVKAAFGEFAALLPPEGVLLVRGDCPAAIESAGKSAARVVTFSNEPVGDSAEPAGDYWATDARPADGGTRFRIFCRGEYLTQVTLRVPGPHNVTNALAAAALCHELGVSPYDIREGLWEFRGVRRRFEPVGTWRGRVLIDDYAHHPTAVRAVLEATRRLYPDRRLCCAFQPHQVSRTAALLPEFAAALALADLVLLAPIFTARETFGGEGGESAPTTVAEKLAAGVNAKGVTARLLSSLDLLADAVDHDTRPGDVLVTMGAGDIDRVHHEFSRRLRRHHAAG
jgi:UDP-N-acetylmuramate--alanine ligase